MNWAATLIVVNLFDEALGVLEMVVLYAFDGRRTEIAWASCEQRSVVENTRKEAKTVGKKTFFLRYTCVVRTFVVPLQPLFEIMRMQGCCSEVTKRL